MSGLERHNPARNLDGDFPDRELVEDALQNLCDAVGVQVEAVEGVTGTSYSCSILAASSLEAEEVGSTQLRTTANGLPMAFSSSITRRSAAAYSARGISEIEPSVVTTRPMVLCSLMTLAVPTSAAMLKGTS